MSKMVHQKVIKPSDYKGQDKDKPNKAAPIAVRRAGHMCIADQIAQDKTIVHMNQYLPELKESFPTNPKMWVTTKCFPFAVGGKLYVDEPQQDYEVAQCLEKAIAMKQFGLRYIFVAPRMSIEDVVGQLEA